MQRTSTQSWCKSSSTSGSVFRLSIQCEKKIRFGRPDYRGEIGTAKQLTFSGRCSGPVLSPDGLWIVFMRAVSGQRISIASGGELEPTELWQIRANGKGATRLLRCRPSEKDGRRDCRVRRSAVLFLAVGVVAEGVFLSLLVLCIDAGDILLDFALEDERFFELATRSHALSVFEDTELSLPQPVN
jgi:hypothetical protein